MFVCSPYLFYLYLSLLTFKSQKSEIIKKKGFLGKNFFPVGPLPLLSFWGKTMQEKINSSFNCQNPFFFGGGQKPRSIPKKSPKNFPLPSNGVLVIGQLREKTPCQETFCFWVGTVIVDWMYCFCGNPPYRINFFSISTTKNLPPLVCG